MGFRASRVFDCAAGRGADGPAVRPYQQWRGRRGGPTLSGNPTSLMNTIKLLRDFDPAFFGGGEEGGVHDGLGLGAVNEGRDAGALIQDGADEFDVLVVTEGDKGIAGEGIARGAGPFEEFLRDGHGGERVFAAFGHLQFERTFELEEERAFAAVDFAIILAAAAFAAAGGELAAFEDASGAVAGKFGEDGDPILEVGELTFADVEETAGVGDEALDGADEEVRVINAVREHVAEFAGAGHFGDLPPANGARAPILQAAGAEMIRLADETGFHKKRHIVHGGDEAIGEGGHVTDVRFFRRSGHGDGFGVVHGDGFFAKDVFAGGDGSERDGRVKNIRRGDDDGVYLGTGEKVFVSGENGGDAGLAAGMLEDDGVGVAEGDDAGFGAERESRQMILQDDAAAADNADADLFHNRTMVYGIRTGKRQIRCLRRGSEAPSTKPNFKPGVVLMTPMVSRGWSNAKSRLKTGAPDFTFSFLLSTETLECERMKAEKQTRRQFYSDNYAGICPEVLAALMEANPGHSANYGNDEWTEQAADMLRDLFETKCEVFFVFNGTAANSLALASICQSYNSIVCHEHAHIETAECGAPEFFSNGSKVLLLPGANGKIDPNAIEGVARRRTDIHFPKAKAISITQATEAGTIYSVAELQTIIETAKKLNLRIHMDGARFANAIAALKVKPKEITWELGVDVLCFGGTKNGMPVGEAVVIFNPELAREFEFRAKQGAQLASKMRFLSAPWVGMLKDGAWLKHAGHANAMAKRLETALQGLPRIKIAFPADTNGVFVLMPLDLSKALRERGWRFSTHVTPDNIRLMCSWDTTPGDVDSIVADIKELVTKG